MLCFLIILLVLWDSKEESLTEISKFGPVEGKQTNCSSEQLVGGQKYWRVDTQNEDVILNLNNTFCQVGGDLCPSILSSSQVESISVLSQNETNSTLPISDVIPIDLQFGDWLTIWLDFFENDSEGNSKNGTSSFLTINRMSAKNSLFSCEVHKEEEAPFFEKSIDNKGNLTFSSDILTAGFDLFSVKLNISSTACQLEWRLNITVRTKDCSKLPSSALCSGCGNCITETDTTSFTCHCCPAYVGKYCEEKDGCFGNPCKHGGFCVDIAEGLIGTTYQCLCRHGYRGKSCEEVVSLCDKKPCQNNGTCVSNQTSYYCKCPAGFTGKDCEVNINECLPNSCVHGMCEDGIAGYKCYCLPGYGGDHCEFEYDECDSSPCINGGACEDLVASYKCHCGPGYRGKRCQIKVDLCHPNPCPTPAQCVDRGNNYSCICHPGYNNPGCTQHYDPCYPSPCQHGGTCWPKLDSFYCMCLLGYTGNICEERMHADQPLAGTSLDTSVPGKENDDTNNNITLDHLHNIYIAIAALTGACFVVLMVVFICHCRVNKTYQHITRKLSRSCSDLKQHKLEDPDKFLLNLRGHDSERDHIHLTDTGYEATSVDLIDNLSVPLIE